MLKRIERANWPTYNGCFIIIGKWREPPSITSTDRPQRGASSASTGQRSRLQSLPCGHTQADGYRGQGCLKKDEASS
ncbi:hypothetical protein RRG08_065980 [Elysia crispata]|uniref:Uncharacterized protein n=1 Tax=Elysia crispata TaxID=231223 RepID=A0AAE1A4S9_9GAST|nr:hypothetical protein RRG08_065980 [Elysia crispata]